MRCLLLTLSVAAQSTIQAAPLSPGDYRFELKVDQRNRSYYIHVPPQAASRVLPVIISLHGGGGNAQQHRQDTGMDSAADRDGYIAVYPNGSGRWGERLLTWNAGGCCGYAQDKGIDDVAFIVALIDDLGRRAAADPRRIYIVGHSNGGMMAHRIGEALPKRIAAIVSVAGSHLPGPGDGRAVPVLQIHSVDDPRALYAGGLGPPFPLTSRRVMHASVDETLAAWARRDGCDESPVVQESKAAGEHTAQRLAWLHCRDGAEVALWRLSGAGHGWPGGKPRPESIVGPATRVIDANTEIWRFLARFSLP